MQKRVLYIAFLLMAICNQIVAEDQITISDFSLSPGDSKEVSVVLANEDTYVGFQFDLYLPDGITVESFSANTNRFPEGTTPQMAQQSDGSYRFIAAALNGNPINGNEGAVLTIVVKAGENVSAKDYQGYLRNVKISKADGSGVTKAEQPFAITVQGAEAYAVLSEGNTTLTFYYDKKKDERNGMSVGPFTGYTQRGWHSVRSSIIQVVFDDSFASYSPTSTALWFWGLQAMTSIQGIENLHTDQVTDMNGMFNYCYALEVLDLSNFNTANVTNIAGMFYGCNKLKSIFVGEGWSIDKIITTTISGTGGNGGWQVFSQCTSLVGGAGTAFDANHTDYTYAHIDGGTNNPGYFTDIADTTQVATERVVTPAFSWRGDELTISTETEGATINYTLVEGEQYYLVGGNGEWNSDKSQRFTHTSNNVYTYILTGGTELWFAFGDGAALDAINDGDWTLLYGTTGQSEDMTGSLDRRYNLGKDGSFHVDGTSPYYQFTIDVLNKIYEITPIDSNPGNVQDVILSYTAPINVNSDALITAWAEKQDMLTSDKVQLDYPYTAWQYLLVAADTARSVISLCEGNPKVDQQELSELTATDSLAYNLYYERVAKRNEIMMVADTLLSLAERLRSAALVAEPEPYAVLSENNTVLTFYYDEKKTERNGMSVGPFAAETDRGWDEYKGNINTAIFDDSFAKCSTITSTAYWFASCYNSLTIQGLNNLKTDNVTDMTMMFHSTWLKDIDVSGFNTSKVTSMRNMFSACSMSSLDVSNFNTENVIDFNGMFSSNSHLTSLDLKNFNTANATSLRAMFSGCTQLTNIDLSSFNTANVTDMNNMFSSCTNLQHLDLSHFNTDKVRDIRRMFLDCRNLTSLDISSLKTDSVLSMEMLFENCAKLESLDLSSFNTKDIWEMRYMFDGCSNLKTIYVSSEWNTGKVSSGENMFRNCTNLVGGKGTTYDANHVDYTYARIDGGPSNPGYFTDKNAQADDGLELYAIDVESEMKSNETFMPTQSVKMTLGNDSEWSTNNDLAPELGGELKFDANIYYPGIYNKNYAFVSSVVGTNNPAAGPLVDGMSTGSSYKPRWRNLPESGAYFIFESEQDGSLIVPIRINPNKPLYVTDDAGVPLIAYQLKDQDGVTVALDANSSTAEKTIAFLSLNVSKNQKYYIFCKGSKPRVGGYIFAPHTIDIDPATTAAALDSLLAEPVDATFDSNGVLSVGGGTTMADALEYVGGRAEVAKTITAIVWNSTASLTNDDLKGLDNPNMLIYVKDAAFAPANRDNVVIGDFAKNIVLTDVESGNNNFYCPQAFTAEMISYTHEYRQQTEIGVARGWETIALPFTVQTIMHEKWGGIVPFGNSNSGANFWLRQMTSNGLQRATKIEANVPYIISMPNNETYDAPNNLAGRVTFSSQDALVPMTEYTSVHMAVENGMLMFVPCFQTTQAHDMIYALNVGETRGNHPEGSVFEANYRDVRPFEAFTVHEGGNKPAPQFILVFDLNEAGFTGIENVRSHMCDGRSDVWYDLNGRRLQQKPTQKGVYLNNRCKVIIR